MRDRLGKYESSINTLRLENRSLRYNTLILGEEGSGKTNLACRIRNYAIDNNVPTLYLDFSDPNEDNIELRYKDEYFNYIRFDESKSFKEELAKLIAEKKHIYMSVNSNYFSNKRDIKSELTQTLQMQELLDNYYYFFHDIENLNGFYTKFEDFLLYMLGFLNLKKYGFTFLTQPHRIFENPQLKLLFTFLYLGKCSSLESFNTAKLKRLPKNRFFYQYRTDYHTLLFNDIKSNEVQIDEYIFEE
ncbi:ATP-binding protein [Candidatus Sulfurimonas marisnigri]|uniref:ATP-binding protein n=1 Tax=Candidatus Sulfurimonas marisnigri TaxID=2740405 RepID=A0A7S7M0W1_9BACT|nr:ATP-binding protein [Candidatus Sulfurimonas marisnigri]QOY54543.1 ATP-binding protein [Candidatus Sulfurimonas marisnigri]